MQIVGTAWTLIPSIVVLALAIKTKRLLESMFIGSIVAFIMLDGIGFAGAWITTLFEQLGNQTVIWVAVMVFLLGSIIQLIQNSGGTKALTQIVLRWAKDQKSSLLITMVLGFVLFIDDYFKAITVSGAMKNITDKYNVPREMLGYTIISVGSTGALLVPFSSWGAYTIGLFGLYDYKFAGSAFATYVRCLPFMVYAFVGMLVCLLVIVGVIPKSKGMKAAYERAESGQVLPIGREIQAIDDDDKKPSLINIILPIGALIVGTILINGDLVYGLVVGVITALVLYKLNGTMTITESVDNCVEGARSMFDVMVIVIFCYVFIGANARLELTEFVIASVESYMVPALFPAITFAVIAALAFITGSFWELAAFAYPIMVPLGISIDANVYMVLASVICGACFGSTACFYSDTNILVGRGCDIELMDMAPKMLPYFVIAFIVTTLGYAAIGLLF